jgi:hypothetical protein
MYGVLRDAMPVYRELKSRIRAIIPEDGAGDAPPSVGGVALSKSKVNRRRDASVTITWASVDDEGVVAHDLWFAPDGADFSIPVAAGLPGDAASYTWRVPGEVPRTKAGAVKVVARDARGSTGEAVSARLRVK